MVFLRFSYGFPIVWRIATTFLFEPDLDSRHSLQDAVQKAGLDTMNLTTMERLVGNWLLSGELT